MSGLSSLQEALVLARRAVRADEEARTSSWMRRGPSESTDPTEAAMADAAAQLYRNAASMLQRAAEAEDVKATDGAGALIESLVDVYGRRFALIHAALHMGGVDPDGLLPASPGKPAAPGASGGGGGAWPSTAMLLTATTAAGPLGDHPVARMLLDKDLSARSAAFRGIAAPPAPLVPLLRPFHRLECAARTTESPGCLIAGSVLAGPWIWAPEDGAPVHHVVAKTAALRRVTRAALRLAPVLAPLSSATDDHVDEALAAFADAALAAHASLASADSALPRPLADSGASLARIVRERGAGEARGRGAGRAGDEKGGGLASGGSSDDEDDEEDAQAKAERATAAFLAADSTGALLLPAGEGVPSVEAPAPAEPVAAKAAAPASAAAQRRRAAASSTTAAAGRVLWGLGEAVRAGAARAADAVSSAWAADASMPQLMAYAMALRAAAGALEPLGLWVEAGTGCGGPRLARRAAGRRGEREEGAGSDGWAAAARGEHPVVDDDVLGPWAARAARLLAGSGTRRHVVAAAHALGRGICAAVASDVAVLLGVQIGAARSAVAYRP